MRDIVLVALLALSFASLTTLHVALAARLAMQKPRWRGLVALVVPPLGLVWALRAGWKKLAAGWIAAVAVYLAALAIELL